MRILRSALKHGCTPGDIEHALAYSATRVRVGEEPVRWLYVGADPAGRLLEIVTIEVDDGDVVVIHAMKLRKRYQPERRRS